MREHALPQDITGYKFHIIGNMTLKQFVEVATGFVIAFLIYQTNLVDFIKWPFMAFFAGLGAMVAFVPIEERPLDQWIIAFFRALYRPTQYYWKRVPKIPEPFLYEAKNTRVSVVGEVDLTPARRQRVKEYLRSIGTEQSPDQIETYSSQRLDEVMDIFQSQLTAGFEYSPQHTSEIAVENLSFVGRATGEETSIELEEETIPSTEVQGEEVLHLFENPSTESIVYNVDATPQIEPTSVPDEVHTTQPDLTPSPQVEPDIVPEPEPEPEPQPKIATETIPISTVFSSSGDVSLPEVSVTKPSAQAVRQAAGKSLQNLKNLDAPQVQIKNKRLPPDNDLKHTEGRILTFEGLVSKPVETPVEKEDHYAATNDLGQKSHFVEVPAVEHIKIEKTISPLDAQSVETPESSTSEDTQPVDHTILQTQPQPSVDPSDVVQAVVQNPNLPFPDKPVTPNKVVGMVLDTSGNPLPNAIVEILTESGMPARAVKTNPLGQFFITTPLNAGQYLMSADHDHFQFETKQLTVNNQVLDPIEIRASTSASSASATTMSQ